MILNRVPASRLNASGKISESAPAPVPGTSSSCCLRSSNVLIFDVYHDIARLTSRFMLPSQVNLSGSRLPSFSPSIGSNGNPRPTVAHDGAVLGRDPVDIFFDLEPAGAGHVLHDDRRLAGNMVGEMANQQPRIDVVGRARARKDDHAELAALVELLRRLSANSASRPPRAAGTAAAIAARAAPGSA